MRRALVVASIAIAACGGESPPAVDMCTTVAWSGAGDAITRWPEPALIVPDATTETGLRLHFDPEEYPDLAMRSAGYLGTLTLDLAEVDGFGINAEAFFQFDRPFDVDAIPEGGVGFVVIEPGPARLVPAILRSTDEGATILMAPLTPLPPSGRAAVYVTDALTDAAGGCIESGAAMRDAIDSADADTQAAIDALIGLGAIADAGELVAITAFPTQSIAEDSVAVAADVAARDYDFESAPVCTDEATWRRCEATFVAQDYRDPADGVFRRARGEPAVPRTTYVVPVTYWLPLTGTGPFPVMVFGHGLGGGRDQARRLAEFAAPMGMVTVAIDAVQHGEHPTTMGTTRELIPTVLAFFGLNAGSDRSFEGAKLRDHFRQSTWDKLQLTRLLVAQPDVTGDGAPDLDVDRIAYLGVSLGGLMGPELLAVSEDYGAGVLVVPGGRVSAIISDGAMFGAIIVAFRPRGTTEGDVRRFFPILQTIIERGDAASYGRYLLAERLPSADAITPSILAGVVLDDDTVPNVANYALGRAIGLPIVEELLREEPGFALVPGPISGNFAGGAATGGLLQFDVIGDGMGGTETATHSNVGDSDVGVAAWLDFLDTHFQGGPARIRDPYAAIGLSHAAP